MKPPGRVPPGAPVFSYVRQWSPGTRPTGLRGESARLPGTCCHTPRVCLGLWPLRRPPWGRAPLGAPQSESWGPCPGGEMVGESRCVSGRCFQECWLLRRASGATVPAVRGSVPGRASREVGPRANASWGAGAPGPERRKGGARQPMASARLVPAAHTRQALAPLWVGGPTGALGSGGQGRLQAGGLKLQAGWSRPRG